MFDFFDTSKLLIIGAVALMVIPPKDLPTVLRQLGQAVGKLRRMATEFQGQFNEALKDELQELESSTTMPLDIGTDFNIAAPAPVAEAVSSPADTVAAPHPAPDMPVETTPPAAAAPAEPPLAAKPKRPAAKSAPAADKALAEGEAVAKPKRARKPVVKAAADTVIAVNKDRETNV